MKSWIEQRGFPVVEAARKNDGLHLTQRRFTYLPDDSDQRWMIPVTVRVYDPDGDAREISFLMENRETVVDIGDRASAYVLENVPDRNRFIPIASMAANPAATPGMWAWYVSHVEILEHSHPLLYERVIAAIVPVCGMGKVDAVKKFFEGYTPKKPVIRDVVRISLEKLSINTRMYELNR
ncbi:MAG: hypothetical protein ABII68_01285 [Pseudomonadota bacterium]